MLVEWRGGDGHGSDLSFGLSSLLESSALTDVTLVAGGGEGGGGRVKAHSAVLAAASDFFRVRLSVIVLCSSATFTTDVGCMLLLFFY